MVKRIIFASCLFVATGASAQSGSYFKPGLLKASLTYGVGDVLSNRDQNFYFAGYAEYVLDEKLSFRGDTYLKIPTTDEQIANGQTPLIKDGARSFFGPSYHFLKGNLDYAVAFQPGVSLLNVRSSSGFQSESAYSLIVSPGFNIKTGFTYYVWKYFNFFAEFSYVRSNLFGVRKFANNADEFIFSAGLGFQIQTKKK